MIFKKAILMIHGFAGGTYDQEDLANYLELNKNFDVFQFTLPGHQKNLSKVKYEEWIKACEDKINWLIFNGYTNIYLVGHSMGGVIATYLASKYSEVKKLVLAAPSFQYLSVIKDDMNIKQSIKDTPKVIKTYGKEEIIARMLKLKISVIKEFVNLVREYYDYPNEIKCPLLILQGKNDNLVTKESSKYVYDSAKSKEKCLILIDKVTHDIFRSDRNDEIFNIVEKFLKYGRQEGIHNI